jgi:hypothetical protein
MRRARGDGKRSRPLAVQLDNARAQTYSRAPFLPHEHDESPETSPLADPVTIQGHDDVARGLVDTERRGMQPVCSTGKLLRPPKALAGVEPAPEIFARRRVCAPPRC